MDRQELRGRIRRLPNDRLLSAFDEDALEDLLDGSTFHEAARGAILIDQGDDSRFAIFPLSGSLKISMVTVDGIEIILGYAGPGEILGEVGLIEEGLRTATITAAEPSTYLKIPQRAFAQVAERHPAAMWQMLRVMAQRLRTTNATVESDRSFSMAGRLARAMIRLVRPDSQGDLSVSISQTDLGAMAGLSRENVNRQLSQWRREGIVSREGTRFRICDLELLRDLAEFGEL